MQSVRIPLDFGLGISDKCAQQKCPFASRQYLFRGSLLELGREILDKSLQLFRTLATTSEGCLYKSKKSHGFHLDITLLPTGRILDQNSIVATMVGWLPLVIHLLCNIRRLYGFAQQSSIAVTGDLTSDLQTIKHISEFISAKLL